MEEEITSYLDVFDYVVLNIRAQPYEFSVRDFVVDFHYILRIEERKDLYGLLLNTLTMGLAKRQGPKGKKASAGKSKATPAVGRFQARQVLTVEHLFENFSKQEINRLLKTSPRIFKLFDEDPGNYDQLARMRSAPPTSRQKFVVASEPTALRREIEEEREKIHVELTELGGAQRHRKLTQRVEEGGRMTKAEVRDLKRLRTLVTSIGEKDAELTEERRKTSHSTGAMESDASRRAGKSKRTARNLYGRGYRKTF